MNRNMLSTTSPRLPNKFVFFFVKTNLGVKNNSFNETKENIVR